MGGGVGSEEGDTYDERGEEEEEGGGSSTASLTGDSHSHTLFLSHPAMAQNRVLIKLTDGSLAAVIGYLYFPT